MVEVVRVEIRGIFYVDSYNVYSTSIGVRVLVKDRQEKDFGKLKIGFIYNTNTYYKPKGSIRGLVLDQVEIFGDCEQNCKEIQPDTVYVSKNNLVRQN